jgi:hypothetical protein
LFVVPGKGLHFSEVSGERGARFDRRDRAVLLPHSLEQRCEQLAALGRRGFHLPEGVEDDEERRPSTEVVERVVSALVDCVTSSAMAIMQRHAQTLSVWRL